MCLAALFAFEFIFRTSFFNPLRELQVRQADEFRPMEDQQIQQTELSVLPSKLDYVNSKPHGNGRRNFHNQYSLASSGREFGIFDLSIWDFLDSITFHRDPFNRQELVNTLKGKELLLFILFFIGSMAFILAMFEVGRVVVGKQAYLELTSCSQYLKFYGFWKKISLIFYSY